MVRQSKGITLPITYKADLGGLNKAQGALQNFGKIAAGIGVAAVSAVAGIAVAGVRAFADFDAKLQQSVAIMGDVSDAMRSEMADAAREVAKATTFSAEEAAESYFFLASAGLDAQQSIAALPKVAAFAQAGMFDMATATDLLTDAQSALGMTSQDTAENLENMARLGDVLVKANTLANASVEQFSSALTNKAAASMRTLNMELEQGVAVLAVFADQGLKGEQAGTAFNATMIGLTKNARENAAAFAALGVEVFDSTGELNSMADIIGDLERGLDGMSTQQVEATLSSLGLTRQALDGTKALLGSSGAIRDYERELRNAGGTVDSVANKQLDTLNAQLELMKSRFQDVKIEIGSKFVPILIDAMKDLEPVFTEIGDLMVEVFEELAPVIRDLAGQLPGLISAFMPLIPVIGDIAGIFLDLVSILLPPFVDLMDALAPIFELIEPVLGTLVGLFELLLIPVQGLINFFSPLIETILPPLTEGFGLLNDAVGFFGGLFGPINEKLMPEFNRILGEVTGPVVDHFRDQLRVLTENGFQYLIDVGILPVGTSLADLAEGAKTSAYLFANFIITAFNMVIDAANAVMRAFVETSNAILRGLQAFGLFKGLPLISFTPMPKIPLMTPEMFEERIDTSGMLPPTTGASFPSLSPGVPRLADGGIVNRATLALIGEAGPEAVVPLDRGGFGSTYNITVNAGMGAGNGTEIGREIVAAIKRYERTSGRVFASA